MIHRSVRLVVALVVLAAVMPAASAPAGHGPHQHGGGHAPVQDVSGVTSLDVYRDGAALHLLVARSRRNAVAELLHVASKDGGATWSAPHPVPTDAAAPHSPRRGADAQLAARGDRLLTLWMVKGSGFMGSGALAAAISEDGGRTWRSGANPADDASNEGHSFVDVVADESAFHAVWLDSRDKAQGLRYAASRTGTSWSANRTLAGGTCECCWNAMLSNADQLYVLYRGKSPRDMAIVASADDGATWSTPNVVGRFGWDVNACPHVGGGLAVTELEGARALHAVVWTGQENRAGLYHLTSLDAGRSWAEPRRIGGEGARHADLAAGGEGTVAAVWDEDMPGHTVIFLSVSRDGGRSWSVPARLSAPAADATHPRIAAVNDGFVVFWTEVRDGAGLRELMLSRVSRQGLPGEPLAMDLGR